MTHITKGCPKCGAVLEIQPSESGGKLVCTRPGCKFRCPLPEDIKLRHQGARMLPGLAEVAR